MKGLSEDCAEPYFLVGDEVTVFDPWNEATELRLSDPDVLFLRQKTVGASVQVLQTAAGVGELVLDGRCLRLKGSSTTIIWPAGFAPHVEGGVVQVRNGAGRIIARVGDEIAGGGGYFDLGGGDCPGPRGGPTKSKPCRMPRSTSQAGWNAGAGPGAGALRWKAGPERKVLGGRYRCSRQ